MKNINPSRLLGITCALQICWWLIIWFMLAATGPYGKSPLDYLFWSSDTFVFIALFYLLSALAAQILSGFGVYISFKNKYKFFRFIYIAVFLLNIPASLICLMILGGSHSV